VAWPARSWCLRGSGEVAPSAPANRLSHAGSSAETNATSDAPIGSGGSYALAAARALLQSSKLSPKEIVQKSLEIAAEICVYTNTHITVLEL